MTASIGIINRDEISAKYQHQRKRRHQRIEKIISEERSEILIISNSVKNEESSGENRNLAEENKAKEGGVWRSKYRKLRKMKKMTSNKAS